jgi:hypothetical protein
LAFFDADYLRLHSFTKNAGMKMAAILGLKHHCFDYPLFLVVRCGFIFKWCFDGFSVVIRQTISAIETPDHMWVSCCKFFL